MEFALSRSKWSDCHDTKSKHIDWKFSLKCDHRVWPWPWPWPWIFKVKYRICYITTKNYPIATKQKTNISIELYASNVTIGFELDHDLDYGFSRSNLEFAISQPQVVWLPKYETYAYRMNLKASMTIKFDLGHDLERWGVRIYRIVTGVTSDVGVPSIRLVYIGCMIIVQCKSLLWFEYMKSYQLT